MAQVNVTINSRQFRMACEDGQEEHLMKLAAQLDERIVELRGKVGEVGDTRLTVMAAITFIDELSEINARLRKLEDEFASAQDSRAISSARAENARADTVAAFTAAAERIESIARKLNQATTENAVALG